MLLGSSMALLVVVALLAPAPAVGDVPGHGRAWELVTPAEPVGPFVIGVQKIAADGSRVAYTTRGPLPGAPAGDLEATTLAIRGADGWASSPLAYPYSVRTVQFGIIFNGVGPRAFYPNLEPSIWLSGAPLVPGAPREGNPGLYRVEPDGTLTVLADMGPADSAFIGASDDASQVVFSADSHLLPGDAGRLSGSSIYAATETAMRLVDVDSSGNLLSACGSLVGSPGGVSRSADRIFFTNPAPPTPVPSEPCPEPSAIYLREGGSKTVEVSASQCTRPDCNAPAIPVFAGATPNGSSVFLVSAQQLTNADHDELSDLYRFDVEGGDLSLISAETPGVDGAVESAWVRASADGSRVYFTAEGRLLPGQGSETGKNLYFADAGGLQFVASTDGGELQISPDGGVVLFETAVAQEAGDSDGKTDVYLWSADTGALRRLSDGLLSGNGAFDAQITPLASPTFFRPAIYHALTDDGKQVFFSTAEQLIPEDGNEVADVYEWTGGELGLVSSGMGNEPAEFAGTSPDGQTVLIKTAAPLLPVDRDGSASDLYAARLGGGFPFDVGPAAECGTDACPPPPRSRVAREASETTKTRAKGKSGRLRLLSVDRRAGASIAAGGSLKVRVKAPAPGRVSGRLSMRGGKHPLVAARGDAGAIRAGAVALTLKVTPAARARLRRLGVLQVRLLVQQGERRLSRELTLSLGEGR